MSGTIWPVWSNFVVEKGTSLDMQLNMHKYYIIYKKGHLHEIKQA